MKFFNLSAADAELYRAVIEEDGPIRLAELAQLLRADGQDLAQFDGSMESLVPLWGWFIDFARADFPGVPESAQSRLEVVEETGLSSSRARYASEFVMHYMFEVAKGYLSDVRWVVKTKQNRMETHETHARFTMDAGNVKTVNLGVWCKGTVLAISKGDPNVTAPESLMDLALIGIFAFGLATDERIRNTPRSGVSILEGLGEPGPLRPPLTFVLAVENSEPNTAEDSDTGLVGDELILAHPKADVENLERARPLDAEAVAQTLVGLGFKTDSGEPITAAAILSREMGEYLRDDHEVAMFATATHNGKLRALHVDAINPTKEQWNEIMTALNGLAKTLKARLAREDEFESSEDD